MITDAIILAGGYGERLWPASTSETPKQFLSIKDDLSFLQQSILRAGSIMSTQKGERVGRIIIASRAGLEAQCAAQCKDLCDKLSNNGKEKLLKNIKDTVFIVAEPKARHTAAAVTLSIYLIDLLSRIKGDKDPHTIAVLTSDHIIDPIDKFSSDCTLAAALAERGFFVCFGVPAYSPSPEYGYIQAGESIEGVSNAYSIAKFHEKPNEETAKSFIAHGGAFWNSGMFSFTDKFFLSELSKCAPDVFNAFSPIDDYINNYTDNPTNDSKKDRAPIIDTLHGVNFLKSFPLMDLSYERTPALPLDKALAERTTHAAVIKASFDWDDIGSWDSFSRHCNQKSLTYEADSSDCFVYSDIPVALCGVSDLNIIIKNGKALILKKGKSALTREISKQEKAQKNI